MRRVFGLVAGPGLGELVLLLEVDLSLFCTTGGMIGSWVLTGGRWERVGEI